MPEFVNTICLLILVAIVVGLIRPRLVLPFARTQTKGRVLLVYGAALFLTPIIGACYATFPTSDTNSGNVYYGKPEQVRYYMPDDYDIESDPTKPKILRDGLVYKIQTTYATLWSIDKKTKLSDLPKGTEVYFDNAIRRFQDHPYIWVKVSESGAAGWLHVMNVGYDSTQQ